MPVISVNGARLNYVQLDPEDASRREDLVMVHGLATNMAFWYFQYAPVLAKRFRVTLFDMRGHGRSEMTESGYAPAALAEDLRGLLDQLGIERAHFVAHSFGGVVTLGLARQQPKRIASLVIADTHLSATRDDAAAAWTHGEVIQSTMDRHGLRLDTRDPYFGYKLLTEVAHLLLREVEIPGELLALMGPMLGKHGTRTAKQWLRLMSETRAQDELMADDGLSDELLAGFRFPALALYGDQSQARPSGEHLRELWPHAETHELRDAGHFFPATRADEVIAHCERFWDRGQRDPLRPTARIAELRGESAEPACE